MRITFERLRRVLFRPFVLGSIDGLITSFVILAGGFAGSIDKRAVLLIGVSSLVADAFSMGVSEYLSSRTEQTLTDASLMGLSCFLSFFLFGLLPILAYVFAPSDTEATFVVTAFAAMLVLVALLRARVVANITCGRSLLEVGLLGGCAGAIAYGVASLYPGG